MENAQQRTENEESEKKSKKRKKNPSNKPPTGKAILYHLYPTSDQKKSLQQWFGVARWTYNKFLDVIKNLNKKKCKKVLRAHCLNKEVFDRDDMKTFKWALDVHYDVRDEAMSDVFKAYKPNLAKGVKFDIQFRSKKDKQQSVVVLNKHWLKKKGVFSFLRTIKSVIRSG